MKLERIAESFSICKLENGSGIRLDEPFCFVGRTDEELSLVCPTRVAPQSVIARDDGWKAVRIAGELDFSLIGVLSGLTAVLAENGVGVFAVSTFNTDYIFVKEARYEEALAALAQAGYEIAGQTDGCAPQNAR